MDKLWRVSGWIYLVLAAIIAGTSAEETISKTDPRVSGEVAGYSMLVNPGQLLDTLDARATSALKPDVYTSGSAKELAGRLLGDPAVLKSAGDKPIVVLFFVPENKDAAVVFANLERAFFVVSADTKVDAALHEAGFRTATENGVIVAASTVESVAKGNAAMAQYRSVLASAPKSGLRMGFNLAALFEGREAGNVKRTETLVHRKWSPAEEAFFERNGLTVRDFEAMTLAFRNLSDGFFEQVAVFQIDADLTDNALLVDMRFEAKKDSVLESFLVAPSTAAPGKLEPLVEKSIMSLHLFGNPRAQEAAFVKLKAAVAADERLKEWANSNFMSALIEDSAAWGGETFLSLGGKTLQSYSLSTVVNAEKQWMAADNLLAPLKADNLIPKLMGLMNFMLDAKFSRNERKHGETTVGLSTLELDISKVDHKRFPQLEKLPALNKWQMQSAIEKGVSVSSMSPATLDKLLDRISAGRNPAGLTLQSERVFDARQSIYLDVDLPQLAAMVQPPKEPGSENTKNVKAGGDLWTTAVGFENGRARVQSMLPYAPVEDVLRAVGSVLPDILKAINRPRPKPSARPGNEDIR